jgi:cytochrome c oxidase subunit 3
MPGTVIEGIEVTDAGRGGGAGIPAGGDDDGGSGGGFPGVPQRAYFTGIALGLGAILMFFMALTSSYIVRKGLGGDWQPVTLPSILWFNTLALLASSGTVELARRQLNAGESVAFRRWWMVTTALGAVFLVGQLRAWRLLVAAGVYLASNPASSFFYVLTAAHGVHLLGGIIALAYVGFRAWPVAAKLRGPSVRAAGSGITQGTAAEITSIYWHFMDGLWVFLFLLLHLGR